MGVETKKEDVSRHEPKEVWKMVLIDHPKKDKPFTQTTNGHDTRRAMKRTHPD